MNVFYEEEGSFKVGAILADHDTSLQVEAPHGKRSKIKSSSVLFRFTEPLAGFVETAQKAAADLDVDFLWECCPQEEFSYEALGRDYFGHPPSAHESAALLLRLHGAPMYFYRKGKGRYRPAPPDALKAALASLERKRQQALAQARYVEQLGRGQLPPEFAPILDELLYRPNRNTIEVKALEHAAQQSGLGVAHLLERCGAIASSHDYHFNRFVLEQFPHGTGLGELNWDPPALELPVAPTEAFSIDDVTTTEIDDAFSVRPLDQGGWEIGVHISAPALGVALGSAVDQVAAARLSTVYMPGDKITMLPQEVISAYSLAEGGERPAVTLYLDVAPDLTIRGERSAIERVRIAANLRHDALEARFNAETIARGERDFPCASALHVLHDFASGLEAARGKTETVRTAYMDYNFYVEGERVRIVERKRGSPLDRLVSELMICVNATWGRLLAGAGIAAIYRAQSGGKVRLSSLPSGHQGLGVAHYIWASSPLRRYVDLINQRQIVAWIRDEAPPYAVGSEELLTAMGDFEQAYEVYAEFQRTMERYWCLRWLIQEGVRSTTAEVVRENLVKVDRIPLIVRVPSLPEFPPGTQVEVEVSNIDLLELTLHAQYKVQIAASVLFR